MRSALKSFAERFLASPLARPLGRARRRGQALVLAYHNVLPPGASKAGDTSLHIPFDLFRRQIDVLESTGSLVSLDDVLKHEHEQACIAVTFDDAYIGALELGVKELLARGIPCTVFVAPGLLGSGVPWWDWLGFAGVLSPETRATALNDGAGRTEPALGLIPAHLKVSMPDHHFRIATSRELSQSVAGQSSVTLGAHSWSHPNLSRVDMGDLEGELRRPSAWLAEGFPQQARPWVAYPYGLADRPVWQAAAAAGYARGFMVSGGWYRSTHDPMAIPRLNVPAGMSVSGFAARVHGVLS